MQRLSTFLLTELNCLQLNFACYGFDEQNIIKSSLPLLNSQVHVLGVQLHAILISAFEQLYQAEQENWENEDELYDKYESIRTSLLSHVEHKISDLKAGNSISNIWVQALEKNENKDTAIEKSYLSAFSETEDMLWLAREIIKHQIPRNLSDVAEAISQLKVRFISHLKLAELSSDREKKVIKLLDQIDLWDPSQAESNRKKIDLLAKHIHIRNIR